MATLISYAQNFEDVILWRALSHVSNGCYVDIGAQSPDIDSVSRVFYERGWRGVHVEPTAQYAELLRKRRPDEVVLQAAVSDHVGISRFFGIADTGLSTANSMIAEKHRNAGYQIVEIQVPAVTLDLVFEQIQSDEVHWLKIDVEGAERKVIDGWTSAHPRPWVLVIESTRPLDPEQSHESWEPEVISRGYEFVYFDGLNRFYVSDRHPELKHAFGAGPNVFDDFSLSPGSQFCAQVNLNYRELEVQAQERQRVQESELQELRAQLHERVAESERRQAEAIELAARIDAGKQEAHRWWSAHEELLSQFGVTLRDMRQQQDRVAAENDRQKSEIVELFAQIETSRQEAGRWRESHEDLRRQLETRASEIELQQAEHADTIRTMAQAHQRVVAEHNAALARANEQAQQEVAELTAQIVAGKHEAHRWWIAHEELKGRLDTIERSRSWRWTSPLRTARLSLSAGPIRRLKRSLRPLVIGSIKVALAIPWLRKSLKPVLARFPSAHGRLRVLAMHERLHGGDPMREIEQQSSAVLGGNERSHSAFYLDKRAERVLTDLKQSRNGKAAQ